MGCDFGRRRGSNADATSSWRITARVATGWPHRSVLSIQRPAGWSRCSLTRQPANGVMLPTTIERPRRAPAARRRPRPTRDSADRRRPRPLGPCREGANKVRTGLRAGGSRIRTLGPPKRNNAFLRLPPFDCPGIPQLSLPNRGRLLSRQGPTVRILLRRPRRFSPASTVRPSASELRPRLDGVGTRDVGMASADSQRL